MKTYASIEIYYQLDESKDYLSFGYFTLWIEGVYQVNHYLTIPEAEKELGKLSEKLGKKPIEYVENGVKHVKLCGDLN